MDLWIYTASSSDKFGITWSAMVMQYMLTPLNKHFQRKSFANFIQKKFCIFLLRIQ